MHITFFSDEDIKPANVFVSSDLHIKLGDLGLGCFFGAKTTAVRSLVGTPYYMSPERLNQLGNDFSSDIWSMGCLLYEVTDPQPFTNHKVISISSIHKLLALLNYCHVETALRWDSNAIL